MCHNAYNPKDSKRINFLMQYFPSTPIEVFLSFWRNRDLIYASVKREILSRYRGSIMGILWSFFNPLLMLSVYTFVFSVVFKARWSVSSESKAEFALVLFSGMIIFNLFSECINRAPTLIVSNVNYVKKVIFPLEILAWASLGCALFHCCISIVVWFVAYVIFLGIPHVAIFYFPLVLLPLLLLTMGLSWILASLGVFMRDVNQFIGVLTTILLFLSPIFYPSSALPEKYRQLIYINPLTIVIEQTRDILFWGKMPNFYALLIYLIASIVLLWIGFFWFQKTRKGFADVL